MTEPDTQTLRVEEERWRVGERERERARERELDGARGRERRARTGTAGCLSDFSSPSSQSELRGQTERISAVLDSGKKPRIRFFFFFLSLPASVGFRLLCFGTRPAELFGPLEFQTVSFSFLFFIFEKGQSATCCGERCSLSWTKTARTLKAPFTGCLMKLFSVLVSSGTPWIYQVGERIDTCDSRSARRINTSKVGRKTWRL